MAKNQVYVVMRVLDRHYLPDKERALAWFEEQWDQTMRMVDENVDGTVIAVKAAFPSVEIPKE